MKFYEKFQLDKREMAGKIMKFQLHKRENGGKPRSGV